MIDVDEDGDSYTSFLKKRRDDSYSAWKKKRDDDAAAAAATSKGKTLADAGLTPAPAGSSAPSGDSSFRESAQRFAKMGAQRDALAVPNERRTVLDDLTKRVAGRSGEDVATRMAGHAGAVFDVGADVGGAMLRQTIEHPLETAKDLALAAPRGLNTTAKFAARSIEKFAGKDMDTSGIPEVTPLEAGLGAFDVLTMGVPTTKAIGRFAERKIAEKSAFDAALEGARSRARPFIEQKRIAPEMAVEQEQRNTTREATRSRLMNEKPSPISQAIGDFDKARGNASAFQDRVEVIPAKPAPAGTRSVQEGIDELHRPFVESARRDRVFAERMDAAAEDLTKHEALPDEVNAHRAQRTAQPAYEPPQPPETRGIPRRRALTADARQAELDAIDERRAIQHESTETAADAARPHVEARTNGRLNSPSKVKTAALEAESRRLDAEVERLSEKAAGTYMTPDDAQRAAVAMDSPEKVSASAQRAYRKAVKGGTGNVGPKPLTRGEAVVDAAGEHGEETISKAAQRDLKRAQNQARALREELELRRGGRNAEGGGDAPDGGFVDARTNRPGKAGASSVAAIAGAGIGGAAGATQGDTPGERIRNALIGAAGGAFALGGTMHMVEKGAERALTTARRTELATPAGTVDRFSRVMRGGRAAAEEGEELVRVNGGLKRLTDDGLAPASYEATRRDLRNATERMKGERVKSAEERARGEEIIAGWKGERKRWDAAATTDDLAALRGERHPGALEAELGLPNATNVALAGRLRNRVGAIGDIRNMPSLFPGDEGADLFGGAAGNPNVAETSLGKRSLRPRAPEPTGTAPELPGKISADEMSVRRDELGAPKSEAEATARGDQRGMFGKDQHVGHIGPAAKTEAPAFTGDRAGAIRDRTASVEKSVRDMAVRTENAHDSLRDFIVKTAGVSAEDAEKIKAVYLARGRSAIAKIDPVGGTFKLNVSNGAEKELMLDALAKHDLIMGREAASSVKMHQRPSTRGELPERAQAKTDPTPEAPALFEEEPPKPATPAKDATQGTLFDVGGAAGKALNTPLGRKALTATVGAGVGAGVDKDNPVRGGAAGAALALVGAGGARKLSRAASFDSKGAARIRAAIAANAGLEGESAARGAARAGERIKKPIAPYPEDLAIDTREPDKLLEHSFRLLRDADGQDEIQETMRRLVAEKKIPPGGRISHEQEVDLADALGLTADDLALKDPKRALSGTEILALKDVTLRDIKRQQLAKTVAADLARPPEERAVASHLVDAMEDRLVNQVTRLTRDVSQKGRDLNLMKLVAKTSDDPNDWLLRARKLADGRPIDDALTAEIVGAVARQDFAAATKAIAKARTATGFEKAGELWQTGLLSAFGRPFRDVMSNLINVGNSVVENQIATNLDQLVGAVTGLRTFDAPARVMVGKMISGAKQGARQAISLFTGGKDPEALARAARRYDLLTESAQSNPLLRAYTTFIRRTVAAPDQIGYEAAMAMGLEEQARVMARNTGAKAGKDFDAAVTAFTQKPTPAMQMAAMESALEAVWQNKTALGEAAAGLRQIKNPAANFAAKIAVPFTQTPSAMATQTLKSTPIAALTTGSDMANLFRGVDMEKSQRSLVKKLSKISVGAGWMGAGYLLAGDDKMTSWYPSESSEAEQWKEQGKLENAVKVGGKWFSLTGAIGPQAQLMAIGAGIHNLINEQGRSGLAATAIGSTTGVAATILDTPMMEGPQTAIEAVKSVRGGGEDLSEAAGKVAASYVGGWVPQFVQRIARARDTDETGDVVMRETRGEGGAMGAVKRNIQQGVPGWRESLPAKVTPFGRTRTSGDGGVAALLSPFRTSADATSDPVVGEFARLKIGVGDRRSVDGESRAMLNDRQSKEGKQLHKVLGAIIKSPEYLQWPPNQEIVDAIENDSAFEDEADKRPLQEKVQSAYLRYIVERARSAQTKLRKAGGSR